MDPIGNISSYLELMRGLDPKRTKMVVLREMLIALAAMLLFNFLGEYIFRFLELKEESVRLASGVILFLIAIKILYPSNSSWRSNLPQGEPFIIPLAIPLIAGPSLLATILLFSHLESCKRLMWTAILVSWMLASVVLLLAPRLYRFLGKNGLIACERLLAMILVMLAIQRFMEGIQQFVHVRQHFP
jgi:multiple antibiotic resistance protein